MDDHHPPRGHLVVAADRRALKAALGNFDATSLAKLLPIILQERFGRNRAEMILQRALGELE